jgi:hypothetical protein
MHSNDNDGSDGEDAIVAPSSYQHLIKVTLHLFSFLNMKHYLLWVMCTKYLVIWGLYIAVMTLNVLCSCIQTFCMLACCRLFLNTDLSRICACLVHAVFEQDIYNC